MMNNKSTLINASGRLDYIDIAKGLGMLTIIWGHICLSGLSHAIVYAFHIPLFFFLSGLVFAPQKYVSFGVFLKKRLKGLLIPYVVYSVLTWIVWACYSYLTHAQVNSYWMPLLQTLIAQGSEGYLVHNVPLWFVMCLFLVQVIYYFLSKLKDWVNALLCIILCVLGVLSTKASFFDFSTLPWSIDVALMILPFYAFGSLLTKHMSPQKQVEWVINNKWLGVVFAVLCAIVVYFGASYNGSVSLGHASLGRNPFVFYGTAIFGVLGFMIVSILISLFTSKLTSGIKWFGRNSFRVMAVHNPIKGVVIVILAKIMHITTLDVSRSELKSLLAFAVTLIITIVIVFCIEWLLKKVLKRNTLLK